MEPVKKRSHLTVIFWSTVLLVLGLAFFVLILTPNFVGHGNMEGRHKMRCINNLRQIDGAKQKWASDVHAPSNATPTWNDLKPYLKDFNGSVPVCPAKGVYSINSLTNPPTCSASGHVIE
jgi:hypothetical protein